MTFCNNKQKLDSQLYAWNEAVVWTVNRSKRILLIDRGETF